MNQYQPTNLSVLNDPIYGFITIPESFISDLIEHPYFQRLRRISQVGLSHLVYPGAHHTRFQHAIGSMHLMQKALSVLKRKGVLISPEESRAVYTAILLHDIGHGPFSHALENSLVKGVEHETLSLRFMEVLNTEFQGALSLAIDIFKGVYPRKFLNQLVSSQLDMDRLDYLKRDSFYAGVPEGNINADRMITMLNVQDDRLVLEEKGMYSVEKFIVARRLMYWQVYLHKTGLAAEKLLEKVLKRAKELVSKGVEVPASEPLSYFLQHPVSAKRLDIHTLEVFAKLDDYDLLSAIKTWAFHKDRVLSVLSENLINRKLPKVLLQNEPFDPTWLKECREQALQKLNMTVAELEYFVYDGHITNQAYDSVNNPIRILLKDGTVKDIAEASDYLNIQALSKPVYKYYICFPKD
ncbi:MAG: HD domain-containing protein [Lutibacter sp.]|nr:HD domain-containing protein [Lutibacter sp.]